MNEVPYIEKELLSRIATGDETAFEELFRTYWGKLYSTAFIISKSAEFAEDVAQEILMGVWKDRNNLPQIENLAAYLNVSARNLVYRKLSRISIENAYRNYISAKIDVVRDAATTESITDFKELSSVLQQGIMKLPPQQQKAFLLSRVNGMSHEQIAAEMNLSKNSVKDYIVKAIAFLRKYLQQYAPLAAFLYFL